MTDDARPEYRRVRVAALQQLAAGGDPAAARELERRGIDVTTAVDVTQLDAAALRRLVLGWRDGVMPADRARSRALAERAQFELECRYRADQKVHRPLVDPRPPVPPAAPPWTWPRPPRCENWRRPAGSTCYPSEADRQRAQIATLAREVYAGRRS